MHSFVGRAVVAGVLLMGGSVVLYAIADTALDTIIERRKVRAAVLWE